MISISPSTHLALLSGDGGVPVDELGEDATEGLDAEGQRGHVEEEDVGDVTGQDAALDGSAHGDGLVGVHSLRKIKKFRSTALNLLLGLISLPKLFILLNYLAGVLSKDLLARLLDLGHPGHSSDEDDLPDVGLGDLSVLQGLVAGLDGLLDQVGHDRLEFGAGEL